MNHRTSVRLRLLAAALGLLLTACSESKPGSSNQILQAVQDLALDPEGRVTAITFQAALPMGVSPGNFEADGSQVPLAVTVAGATATVTWDERVTPSHQVRAVGVVNTYPTWSAVDTTDDSVPTFAITAADQVPGLGTDTLTIQFTGPHVVEAQAEDPASWDLEVNGVSLDLTGSVFALDTVTQELTVTLGPDANLWATFDLAATSVQSVADVDLDASQVGGVASGDAVAPTLLTAEQNLAEDPYGRVIDFTFDEAMDPVFATALGNFDAGFPVFSSSVEQPSDEVLRVTFTQPVIPGYDTVALTDLFDAHGNAAADGPTAVVQAAPVANAYTVDPEVVAVANLGGDHVVVETDQPLEATRAADPAHWALEVDGTPVDLSLQTLSYDFLARTLTIDLLDDWDFGAPFTLTPSAVPGDLIDVDGDDFDTVFVGAVSGDDTAPAVVSALQNRDFDPTGRTVDVVFGEHLDDVEAETAGNWAVTGLNVQSATLLPGLTTVRLVLDGVALPSDVTVDVAGVEDLAGNGMALAAGLAVTSTDTDAPAPTALTARALEGFDNDDLSVTFDDDMLASEVVTPANWIVESPPGNALDTSLATIGYDEVNRVATLVFDGGDGIHLQVLDEVEVRFVNMRDLGGNVVEPGPVTAPVDAETGYPVVDAIWVEDFLGGSENLVHVRFSEPAAQLDDLYDALLNPQGKTVYTLRDAGGAFLEVPSAATPHADSLGVELTFSFAITAGVQQLDVRGVTDLAGNQMFPVELQAIASEDPDGPALAAGLSTLTATTGEENDRIVVELDKPLSRWTATEPAAYALERMGVPVELSGASFDYQGGTTLVIDLDSVDADNLTEGASYDLTITGLISAQGVPMGAPDSEAVVAAGDVTPPAFEANRVRLDAKSPATSILIELDEAVEPRDAVDENAFDILGVHPDLATRLGYRTVRATWSGGVAVSDVVNVSIRDLAGNAGALSQAAVAQDATGPLLVAVEGRIAEGFGGDLIAIDFNVPIDVASASNVAHYTVEQGGTRIDLSGATVRYESGEELLLIELPAGTELDAGQGVDVTVTGVLDHAGLAVTPATLPGPVSGDATPPDLAEGFANYRLDPVGRVLDLRFTEDVIAGPLAFTSFYTLSGGQSVIATQMLREDIVRVTLDGALAPGDTISVDPGLRDAASNATVGMITVAPSL